MDEAQTTVGGAVRLAGQISCPDLELKFSCPVCSIQTAVLDGFGDMFRLEVGDVFQIGYGSRDLEYAVVSAGAEALLRHGSLNKTLTVGRKFTECPDVARAHLGIAIELFT